MSAWLEAARAVKRALVGTGKVDLCGHRFRVTAQTRGVREDRDYPVIAALARGRSLIFDVGANLGVTSLLMAKVEPAARVVAFEASEEACRIIRRNLELNGLDERVEVVEAVIAERSGLAVDFFWDHASGGASTLEGYLGHRRALRKTSLCLDDFLEASTPAPGASPDLLKIDVEGAETRVLEGAVISSRRPDPTPSSSSTAGKARASSRTPSASSPSPTRSTIGYSICGPAGPSTTLRPWPGADAATCCSCRPDAACRRISTGSTPRACNAGSGRDLDTCADSAASSPRTLRALATSASRWRCAG